MADATNLDIAFKVGEILAICGSAALALITVGRSAARVEVNLKRQSEDIGDMKADIKNLNQVMTTVALQAQRLDMMTDRINSSDKRYDVLDRRFDELRRGRGFIKGETGLEREY